jgi:hypothetical protein
MQTTFGFDTLLIYSKKGSSSMEAKKAYIHHCFLGEKKKFSESIFLRNCSRRSLFIEPIVSH